MKNRRNLGIHHLCRGKMSMICNVQSVSLLSIVLSNPDPPSRHHLPFDRLMALRKAEGRRCLRSLLSFDLEALDRLAAYCSIRLSRRSSAPCI